MEKSKYLLVNDSDHTYLGFFELSPQEAELVDEILNCLCDRITSMVADVYLLNLDNEEFYNTEKGE